MGPGVWVRSTRYVWFGFDLIGLPFAFGFEFRVWFGLDQFGLHSFSFGPVWFFALILFLFSFRYVSFFFCKKPWLVWLVFTPRRSSACQWLTELEVMHTVHGERSPGLTPFDSICPAFRSEIRLGEESALYWNGSTFCFTIRAVVWKCRFCSE